MTTSGGTINTVGSDSGVVDLVGLGLPSFQLFVAGTSATALGAIALLQRACGDRFGNAYELEVVDVLSRPDLADDAHVMATPTVVRHRPHPIRRVVGDLTGLGAFLDGAREGVAAPLGDAATAVAPVEH